MLTGRHIRIGTIFGIPLELDFSWFLIVGLLSWTLAVGYYPAGFPGWTPVTYWAAGAITSLLLFASVLVHELGHSLVARHYGVPVKRITLFIFGGVSEMVRDPDRGSEEFWIALVGPLTSLAVAVVFWALRFAVAPVEFVYAIVSYLALINLVLAIFNLIPGFPLDGGNVLRAVIWQRTGDPRRATIVAANIGRAFAYLLIFAGIWLVAGADLYDGLWVMFIGWFLESAAVAQIQQLHVKEILQRHRVAEAMERNYAFLSADTTLQELADWHILGTTERTFVVRDGEQVVGLTSRRRFDRVPRGRWPSTTVRDVMDAIGEAAEVSTETDLWTAVERLQETDADRLVVVDDTGAVVGTLSSDDVAAYLRALGPQLATTR